MQTKTQMRGKHRFNFKHQMSQNGVKRWPSEWSCQVQVWKGLLLVLLGSVAEPPAAQSNAVWSRPIPPLEQLDWTAQVLLLGWVQSALVEDLHQGPKIPEE